MAKQDAVVPQRAAPVQPRGRLVIVGGGKGGTGKSTACLGLIDYLRQRGFEVIVVEMDTSNADVAKCYLAVNMPEGAEPPKVVPIDFERPEAWMDLVDLCVENPTATVVVNTKGGNVKEIASYGSKLNDAATQAGLQVIAIWALNLFRDSVLAMTAFRSVVPSAEMFAFLNEVWGRVDEFDVYAADPIKAAIERAKPPHDGTLGDASQQREVDGRKVGAPTEFQHTLAFPRVANRILKGFFNDRRSLEAQAAGEIPFSTKTEIASWREATSHVFRKVLG